MQPNTSFCRDCHSLFLAGAWLNRGIFRIRAEFRKEVHPIDAAIKGIDFMA
jgi:hypothetical protein